MFVNISYCWKSKARDFGGFWLPRGKCSLPEGLKKKQRRSSLVGLLAWRYLNWSRASILRDVGDIDRGVRGLMVGQSACASSARLSFSLPFSLTLSLVFPDFSQQGARGKTVHPRTCTGYNLSNPRGPEAPFRAKYVHRLNVSCLLLYMFTYQKHTSTLSYYSSSLFTFCLHIIAINIS